MDEIEDSGELWWDGAPLDMMSPLQAKRYCQANGHNWNSVSPEMRRRKARSLVRSADAQVIVVNDDGFGTRTEIVDGLRDQRWLSRCPVMRSGFNVKQGFRHFTIAGDCDSWWCPKCGVRNLASLHAAVSARVAGLSVVYTATTAYESGKLAGRVRQRARTAHAEYFWYRYVDFDANGERVAYVATDDLGRGARKEPKLWSVRTGQAALDWLQTDVMTFPGYIAHDWSDAWDPKPVINVATGADSDWLWFQGLNKNQADVARTGLCVKVKEMFDIDLDRYTLLPSDQRDQIADMLCEIVAMVTDSGKPSASATA